MEEKWLFFAVVDDDRMQKKTKKKKNEHFIPQCYSRMELTHCVCVYGGMIENLIGLVTKTTAIQFKIVF